MIGIKVSKSEEDLSGPEFVRLHKTAEAAVFRAALYFEGKLKLKLTGPRTGRIYMVGARGRTHTASAPGEPPASNTGHYRQSITHTRPAWTGEAIASEVGTAAVQAAILEFGGMTGRNHAARILPRPLWAATWLEEEEALNAILGEAVQSSGDRPRDERGRFL